GAALLFDFNAPGSPTQAPTAPGYVGVLPDDSYTVARGYGWNATVGAFDRGDLPGTLAREELRRDGHWGTTGPPGVFQVDLPSGTYLVNVTIGDTIARDNIRLRNVDSGAVLATVSTTANQWAHQAFTITVSDGSLNLEVADMGGDSFWVINGLEIRPAPV